MAGIFLVTNVISTNKETEERKSGWVSEGEAVSIDL